MRRLDSSLLRPAGWLAAGAMLLAPAVASGAEAGDVEARATLERSVRFLQEAQNPDGGFGAGSDPIVSAWAAYALAAAGINPRDQARPGGIDVHTYLTDHTDDLYQTTDFARVALVALASGTSPRRFGGTDPIGTILSRQLPDGSFPQEPGKADGWVNATIWSIFPLSAIGGDAAEGAIARAAAWLLDHQHASGGWTATRLGGAPDTDTTGAAIQALNAAGLRGTETEVRALEYLRGAQRPDGGFEALAGFGSNSATTAWVIQGMWAAGVDPRSWRTASGPDPLSYLASLQRPDGSIGYTATSDTNSLWMTAQVGPALAGRAYPLAAVPRQAEPSLPPPEATAESASPPREETRRAARRGSSGVEVRRGEGVIAGGGGGGAPLFSAPQPQSGGATPGGMRGGVEAGGGGGGGGESATATGRAKRSRDGGAGGERVEGTVVTGMRAVVAPGLLAAADGGDPDSVPTAALLGALILAGALGAFRERSAHQR